MIKYGITLRSDEEAWFNDKRSKFLEFGVSENIIPLLKKDEIRLQFIPQVCELDSIALDFDPLKEIDNSITNRLIHRYKNRVALLVTDKCFAYCRHCFRRRWTSKKSGEISKGEIHDCIEYIKTHPEITEILLTGGDPLTLSNSSLEYLLKSLRDARENIIIRLCTRALLSNPERFDDDLLSILKNYNKDYPLFLLVQFNHKSELNGETVEKIRRLRMAGIFMFNQTVILKDVNDSIEAQSALAHLLLSLGIKPYYVFIPDKVKGTEHFFVSIEKAIEIERNLRLELSGLEMPVFALDLPESGGKIPIHFNYIKSLGKNGEHNVFYTPSGDERIY